MLFCSVEENKSCVFNRSYSEQLLPQLVSEKE